MPTPPRGLAPFVAVLVVSACAKDPPAATKDAPPTAAAPQAAAAPTAAAKGGAVSLGEPIPAGAPLIALSEVAKDPAAFGGKSITTTGTVTSVCQAMGCWMEIKDDVGQAHIKMAGHGFFVPKTASGRKAKVMATLASSGGSCNEDDCHPPDLPGSGGELAKLQLVATGVELD